MRRDPLVSVLDILGAAGYAAEYVHAMDFEHFMADHRTRFAVWAQIVIIGEAVRRSPKTGNATVRKCLGTKWRE